ncbi:hypothetical protein D1007_41387 [Hordeum vulgare]|nr:hypothetical protein D1007_41387 [Hordeum vulgare]
MRWRLRSAAAASGVAAAWAQARVAQGRREEAMRTGKCNGKKLLAGGFLQLPASETNRNELAAKLRFAPLEDEIKLSTIFEDVSVTNEYVMAAPPSSQVGCSQILIDDDDVEGSGCDIDVTNMTPKYKGCKKRSCPYSPSPVMVQKIGKDSEERMQFKCIADLWEKRETSRNSVTSKMKVDLMRDEMKEMKDMVVNDGGIPKSEVYFHALELFTKKEHRDVFSELKDELPSVRLEWINRAWETFMKKN